MRFAALLPALFFAVVTAMSPNLAVGRDGPGDGGGGTSDCREQCGASPDPDVHDRSSLSGRTATVLLVDWNETEDRVLL